MMLMLSRTGLGSWAHMNLHESKSPEERRQDSVIGALDVTVGHSVPLPLHLCPPFQKQRMSRFSTLLVSRGGHGTAHSLNWESNQRLRLAYISTFPTRALSPGFRSSAFKLLIRYEKCTSLRRHSAPEGRQKGTLGPWNSVLKCSTTWLNFHIYRRQREAFLLLLGPAARVKGEPWEAGNSWGTHGLEPGGRWRGGE